MTENKPYLRIPTGSDRAVAVTGSTDYRGPVVHVGEFSPGCFPSSASLTPEQAGQVRDALTQWLDDVTPPLPTWDQMSDLDKGAALLHLHKCENEGTEYATSDYPAEYFEHPALTTLDGETASKHARDLFEVSVDEVFDAVGDDEYHRLYKLALGADRKRYEEKRAGGDTSC